MSDLTALVGSRICHDLINPLGAIGNGMELLAMSAPAAAGVTGAEEMALISDSVARANARIRMFRLAFGAAPPEARVAGHELCEILAECYGGGRLSITADPPADMPRTLAKIALLAVLCAETALPRGGRIALRSTPGGMTLTADGPRLTLEPRLWAPLADACPPPDGLRAAEVQFALLPRAVLDCGRQLAIGQDDTRLTLSF
ncbi:MAG: histidine phosphotransferase [Rhodobacteraceae bacterium]|nr:histidine phosphotransferase [Paracoccaceae bacterium]